MDARWRGLPGLASRRARATRALTRVSCPTWQCPSGPPEMEEAMTRPFVWFLTGLIMLGVASTASAAAQDEVAQVIATRVQAFNEGNLEAFMSTVAQDSAVTPPASPFRIEGKDAISAYYAGLFQAFPTRRFVPRHRSLRVSGPTAVTNSYYT